MDTYKASEFKAKCLKIMDVVAETGERVVITKHGVPVVEVVPWKKRSESAYGVDKGSITILSDIVAPMPGEWFEDSVESEEDLF